MLRSLSRWIAAGLVAGGTAADAAPRPVVDRFYDCRVIARSTEFPPSPGGASMSASGTVAFFHASPSGLEEIRVGDGELDDQGVPISHAIARVGGNGTFEGPFSRPSINDSGQVAFGAVGENSLPEGQGGFWVVPYDHSASAPAGPRYFPGGPFSDSRGSGQINAFGVPLFISSFETNPQRTGLFRGGNLEFEPTSPDFQGFGDYVSTRGGSDDYAFEATVGQFPNQESQLFFPGGIVDSVALPGAIVGLSIGGGRASYVRFEPNGEWRLLVTGQFPPASERVDSTEDAIDASNFPGEWPATSINGYGDVAFEAIDATLGGRRIFVADGQQIGRMVCQNGITFGGGLGSRSFNSDGQIVFGGRLPDGVTLVIARADPIDGLPASCSALADETPCSDGDPETDARCEGGECIGVGPGRPTSCVGLPNDTPCDDLVPETFAYCDDAICRTAPEAEGALAITLASLAGVASWRRAAKRPRRPRARRGRCADRRPARR